VTLTFDLLTLKVVSESRLTWATSVPILVFLGLSVLDLGPMYATDRRQTSSDVICASSLNASALHNKYLDCLLVLDNTFENYMIEKYQPVSLSKHKNALWLYFESSLCFDVRFVD